MTELAATASETSIEHPWSLDGLGAFELQRLRDDVEKSLKEKILMTYVAKGKITNDQARAMFGALQNVMDDWCSGETAADSLFSNFKHHYSISPEAYEEEFRPKMEYLLKIARQEYANRLTKEL